MTLHDVYDIEINDEQQRDVLMAAIIVLEHIHSCLLYTSTNAACCLTR